ncbi:MAG: hypothetical protein A2103_02170 [Gammaproteobacteria bacterium GWF2_41_13]|nr:MAG: hypothetical protein A2103_02170 [Gammaproteobacteria bacterium GWF2_41_13]
MMLPLLEELNKVPAVDIRPGGNSAWIVQQYPVKQVWEFVCRVTDLEKKYALLEALTVDQLQEFLAHLLSDDWASLNALLTLLKPTTEPSIIYQAAKSKIMGGLSEPRMREAGKTCQPEKTPIIFQILEHHPDRQQWLLEGYVDNQEANLQTLLIRAFTTVNDRVTINPDSINPFQKSLLTIFDHKPQWLESFICVFFIFASTDDTSFFSIEHTESFISWYIGNNAASLMRRLQEIERALALKPPSDWLLSLNEQIRNYLVLKKNSERLYAIGSTIPIDETSLFFGIIGFFKTDITSQELVTRTHIRNDAHRLIHVLSACADNTELRNLVVTRLGKESAVTIIRNLTETAESIGLFFDMITAFKKNPDVQASIIQAYIKHDPHPLIRVLSVCDQRTVSRDLLLLRLGPMMACQIIGNIPDSIEDATALFLDMIIAFKENAAAQTSIVQAYIKNNPRRLMAVLSTCNGNTACWHLVIDRLGQTGIKQVIKNIYAQLSPSENPLTPVKTLFLAFDKYPDAQKELLETFLSNLHSDSEQGVQAIMILNDANQQALQMLIRSGLDLFNFLKLINNASERFALFCFFKETCPAHLKNILQNPSERHNIQSLVPRRYWHEFSDFFQTTDAQSASLAATSTFSFLWSHPPRETIFTRREELLKKPPP